MVPGPVIAGGIGGSGTRVLFKILQELGYYLGKDLNSAGDNLWFAILFKRPLFLQSALENDPERITRALQLFDTLMTGSPGVSHEQVSFYFHAAHEYYRQPFHRQNRFTPARLKERMDNLPTAHQNDNHYAAEKHYRGWGWKEPNAFIYLESLSRFYPDMKYIHLIRHGLDMAWSNRHQFRFWASFFGLEQQPGWEDYPLPVKKLKYWLKANTFAVETGRELLGNRFLALRLDELCHQPEKTIDRLLEFLDTGNDMERVESSETIRRLYSIPRVPLSMGRYKQHSLDIFTSEQLDGVRSWGFEVVD